MRFNETLLIIVFSAGAVQIIQKMTPRGTFQNEEHRNKIHISPTSVYRSTLRSPMAASDVGKSRKEKKKEKKVGIYRQSLYPEDFGRKATFINVTVRDASEAVYDRVHAALRHVNVAPKLLPKLKGKVANKIATVASKRVPPSKIAQGLSEQLPKLLMYHMYHNYGMTISARTMFVEDAFFVVQLQVLKVDPNRLLKDPPLASGEHDNSTTSHTPPTSMQVVDEWLQEQAELLHDLSDDSSNENSGASSLIESHNTANNKTQRPDDFGTYWYNSILGMLPEGTKSLLEGETLPQIVQSKLTERMQLVLLKQLESRNLTAEIAVLPEEEQARYFFPYLQQLRQRKMTLSGAEKKKKAFGGAV